MNIDQTSSRKNITAGKASTVTEEQLKKALDTDLTGKVIEEPVFAVVAPVVFEEDGAYLLLEVRASGIPQAGDPCFPGGKIEEGETPEQAASREMQEELGISVPPEEFLGELPAARTYLGNLTKIFVCSVSPELAGRTRINPDEVSVMLKVPMPLFLAAPYAMEYRFEGHIIWGMTCGAIRNLCKVWKRAEQEQ